MAVWIDTLMDRSGFHPCSVPWKEGKELGHITPALKPGCCSVGRYRRGPHLPISKPRRSIFGNGNQNSAVLIKPGRSVGLGCFQGWKHPHCPRVQHSCRMKPWWLAEGPAQLGEGRGPQEGTPGFSGVSRKWSKKPAHSRPSKSFQG